MADKLTPGEWKAEYVGTSDAGPHGVDIYEVIADGHNRVCEAVFRDDARLLAAAKDLLEALQELVEFRNAECEPGDSTWAKVDAALSKALGREGEQQS